MINNQILIVVIFLLSFHVNSQKYFTRSGNTQFEASEKAFEPVEAINNSSTAILDVVSGTIVSQVFIAGFQFKNALMQEHFNENYMDTYEYPKATFKGKLNNFSILNLDSTNPFNLNGILTIREIEKNIETTVNIREENNRIYLSGKFSVKPEDFNIKIPSIVEDKIANHIEIKIDYVLIEKK